MLLLCYPQCTTCRKAKNWLEEHGVEYTERNIKTENPSAGEINSWWKLSAQPLKKFFNTSGSSYKELGLSKRLPELSEDEQITLLAADGMLVKRPIAVTEDKVLIGFKAEEWEKELAR